MNEIGDVGVHAQVFKALGHPVRLRMIHLLADGERCVCELTAAVGLDMSTVSKHLAQMVQAGVLVNERRANKVFYRLRTPCVLEVLACLGRIQAAPDATGTGCCAPRRPGRRP
jgi:ArsR family transcriptional regulator